MTWFGRLGVRTGVLVIAATWAVACSASGGPNAGHPARGRANPDRVEIGDPVLRVQRYFDQADRLASAEAVATEACFRRHGRTVRLPRGSVMHHIAGRLWPDEGYRRRWGYGFTDYDDLGDNLNPSSEAERLRVDRIAFGGDFDDMEWVMTPLGRSGVARHGCLADARRQIYGTLRDYLRAGAMAEDYAAEASAAMLQNRRYLQTEAAWVRCMADVGLHYQRPSEILKRFEAEHRRARGRPTRPSTREVATALADARCQRTARMPQVLTRELRRWVRDLPPEQSADLRRIARARAAALERIGP